MQTQNPISTGGAKVGFCEHESLTIDCDGRCTCDECEVEMEKSDKPGEAVIWKAKMTEKVSLQPPVDTALVYKSTFWERLGWRLFRRKHIDMPDVPGRDCLVVVSTVSISWLDRLRILFSGRAQVTSKTVTENIIGQNTTVSVFNALPPKFMER